MTSRPSFIGLDTQYPTADKQTRVRLHLDGAASPLAATTALETIQKLLPHYSNSHSYVHSSAQISTQAQAWAHDQILESLGADREHYTAIFLGSGTTAGINRVARGLAAARPDKKVVLVSSMEHHANDLPHRQFGNQVIYIPLTNGASSNQGTSDEIGAELGAIDLKAFEALCKTYSEQINYVALSSVSNVTGISNPVEEICAIAHRHGALVLIDGAQQVAHTETKISETNVDFFVFSGHKVYTPMSPGVLIAKKSVLAKLSSGQDLGGGSVSSVSYFDFQLLNEYPDKEQSGTPNIVGAVALANVLKELCDYGFENITAHASSLMASLVDGLKSVDGIVIYGDSSLSRTGALAFNHKQIDHGLLAAILNDYYAIAVRNECFCAHPYVSSLIKEELWELDLEGIPEHQHESLINRKRGMVRASLSLYNSKDDVTRLISALKEVVEKIEQYRPLYTPQQDGSYTHTHFKLDWQTQLNL